MTPQNTARLILSRRDHLPLDVEGPVLSVSSIMAIVIVISLAVATAVVMLLFVRRRRREPNQANNPVAHQRTAPTANVDIEMIPTPRPIAASTRSSTYDQGVPAYDPRILPEYYEKPPPSPSASSSSQTH